MVPTVRRRFDSVGHCERIDTYLQPIEPRTSRKMSRSFFFDYLLSLLAPLIAFLFSKIQMSAPRSKYVVVHNAGAAPADLIISTEYLEIYANHNLTAALLIGLSVLSILHLVYFIYAVWQPLQPVNLPWRTEFETYGNPEDEGALARSRTNWHGAADILQSRLPDQGVHRQSTIRVVTLKCDRPPQENSELKELTIPVSALIRGETSLRSKSATYERQHRPGGGGGGGGEGGEDESDDWKTIYCEEWLDGLHDNC
jgi:hypothetical protein